MAKSKKTSEETRQQSLMELLGEEKIDGDYLPSVEISEIERPKFSALPTAKFIADVKANGVYEPLLLCLSSRKGGKLKIVSGNRRFLAAELAGQTTVPGIITKLSLPHASALKIKLNKLRVENLLNDVEALRELFDGGFDDADIAASTALTKAEIQQRRKLMLAEPELRAAVLDGRCPAGLFKDAAGLPPAQQKALVQRLAEEDCERLTFADLKEVKQVRQSKALAALPASLFTSPPGVTIPPTENGSNGASQKAADPRAAALSVFAGDMFDALDMLAKVGAFNRRGDKHVTRATREATLILERARQALLPSLETKGESDD